MSKINKEIAPELLTQREIGLKLQKIIKNSQKAFQFTKYLSKAVLGQQIYQSSEIKSNRIHQSLKEGEIFAITSSKQFNRKMKQKKNLIHNSKLLNSKLQIQNPIQKQSKPKQKQSKFNKNDQNNQFLQLSTSNISQSFIKKDNKYLDSSSIFKEIQIENKIQSKPNHNNKKYESKAQSQSLQVEEQYFQIQVQISGSQTYTHYVKMNTQDQFNSKLSKNSQGQSYNLSNFSSFNGGSMQTNQVKMTTPSFQDQFYQQQLMYLVKSIQTKFSKKLTPKGIQKLAQQLHDLAHTKKQIKAIKDAKSLTQIHKNKNVTTLEMKNEKINYDIDLNNKSRSSFTKKTNKSLIVPSNSCIKAVQQVNSKKPCINSKQNCIKNKQNCIKSKQNCINKQHCIKNKQNLWSQAISPIAKGTSTSQLSYRVMMQKKNKPNQKSISPVHKPILNSQVSKPSLLKILIQQGEKLRTLYFQYENGKNIEKRKKQIQEYCTKNKVNDKNKNIIREAIQQNKSIITLKHF